MRDEAQEREPHQQIMPFIATPTQTTDIHQAHNSRSEPPVITAVAKEPETSPFVLGPDTCGFTIGSTITCDFGYECENVDNYRGCCVAGATDCSATIYTGCVNYEEMPDAAMCGPHTLCCPESKAYCATYEFTTEGQPGATFTHVQCAESPSFGELYPYPPELSTTTEGSSTENLSSTPTAQPVNSTHPSPSSSVSSGAIAGAVVGSVIFAALAILGIFLFISRRRRWREERIRNGGEATSTTPPSMQIVRFGDNASLRPLSTIHEQQASLPSSASSGDKQGPAPSTLRPRSFGENWPLGPGIPISPRNPLSSNPVTDLEKRPSQNELPPPPQSNRYRKNRVPSLRMTTPPLPGTHLSPPPPLLKKSELAQTSGRGSSTSAIGLALQSPRLSYIPPPTIDTAFGEEFERMLNSVGEPGHDALDKSETTSSNLPFFAIGAPWPTSLDTTAAGMNNQRLTNNGVYLHDNLVISGLDNGHKPASPLDGGDYATGDQRISFVSAPRMLGNMGRREVDYIVSPLSPDDVEEADGWITPMTVSPLESRRGSFGV
ncbi:hypothetical protein F4824DRAFT_510437 [Ustulina deusta]|nr:hypothetical protein F4824DRAFT_510437 [Ustulina deusta]